MKHLTLALLILALALTAIAQEAVEPVPPTTQDISMTVKTQPVGTTDLKLQIEKASLIVENLKLKLDILTQNYQVLQQNLKIAEQDLAALKEKLPKPTPKPAEGKTK